MKRWSSQYVSLIVSIFVGSFSMVKADTIENIDLMASLIGINSMYEKKEKLADDFLKKIDLCKQEWTDFMKARLQVEKGNTELQMAIILERENPSAGELAQARENRALVMKQMTVAEQKLNACMGQLPRKTRVYYNSIYQLFKAQEAHLGLSIKALIQYINVRMKYGIKK